MSRRKPSARVRSGEQLTADEAARVLRANLLVTIADLENPVVLVTSAGPGEGKTTIATTLAASLARGGTRTVLVDLDLRDPDAHAHLGFEAEAGASDVLEGRMPLEDVLRYVGDDERGFYFLPAGPAVENPTELLGARRTGPLLTALAQQAEIVVIDTAPVLPVADTLVLGRLAAGAILVVRSRATAVPAALRAKDNLTRNQVRILGAVVNRVTPSDGGYSYGYGYGEQLTSSR